MYRILILLALIALCIPFSYYLLKPKEANNKELPVAHNGQRVSDFSFTNQDGDTVNKEFIAGKVVVAEYFFTTCKTICPIMTKQMQRVQTVFSKEDGLRILSFTCDPETDTVEQLKRYASAKKVNSLQWQFLTGDKKELYNFARNSLYVLKPDATLNQADDGSDFIHTNNFVLLDKLGQIRGYYDGTSEKEVNLLIVDIKSLLN
jgi:protein SCO1/2